MGFILRTDKTDKMDKVRIKDADIKKLSTTKQEFYSALKKVSQRVENPKPASK